jgi:hypothetical protein
MEENRWRSLYKTAVLEVNPNKLEACVKTAEAAISKRFASLDDYLFKDERLAMQDALSQLRALKQEWEENSL